ncbi:ciliary neurotrophic factor receptor subunit alpha isoform X2 [Pogona vitticeps]
MHLPAESLFGTTPNQRIIRSQHFTASTEPGSYRFCPSYECQGRCSRLAPSPSTRFLATSADLHPVPEAMASPVPAGCCVLLAAVVVVVYAQRPSQQETHIHYAQLGTDVTLLCGSVDQDAAVTWTANSTDLDASHLNGSRLVLRNVDLSHSGQYTCYEGPSWHVKYRVNLRVGLPPKEPIVMCRSNNYPNGFYCSWHLPSPTYINDTFNITVVHDSKEIVCKKETPPKNRCYIQFLQVFSTKKYKVTLTASNPLGSSSTTISFDEFAIVKPDPPENVVAKPVPNNARRLLVSWQYPSSWPDPDSFPLKFFLRWSSRTGPATSSPTPTLARSTSSRWRPRTTTSGHGVIGAWRSMPHLGQRSPSISPQKPREQRRQLPALRRSWSLPPPGSRIPTSPTGIGPWRFPWWSVWCWWCSAFTLFNPAS